MKYRFGILISTILLFNISIQAQVVPVGNGWVNTQGISGAGITANIPDGPTKAQRMAIQSQLNENIALLRSQGKLPAAQNTPRTHITYSLPIQLQSGINDYSFYSITAYVDHDTAYPNHLQDYQCGTLTYDKPNAYNHQGTDFFLWPFPWYRMDHQQVKVVAAAAGTIIMKQDGEFDRSCTMNSNPWNAVYLLHSDNSVSWYGHLKKGSLTSKNVGQSVAEGEMLGIVGSSGISTGPHLHFEVYDVNSQLIDPFSGPCNNFNTDSWWKNQLPYMESGINKTMTNFTPPVFPACPAQEYPNASDNFTFNDTVWVSNYFRYLNTGDLVSITIKRPDGSVWYSWDWNSPWPFYTAAYAYWWIKIGAGEPAGLWTFQTVYNSQTYTHEFTMGYPAGISASNTIESSFNIFPNPATNKLTITYNNPDFHAHDLQITDILGKHQPVHIEKLSEHELILDISALNPGFYFLSSGSKGIRKSSVFVKQ